MNAISRAARLLLALAASAAAAHAAAEDPATLNELAAAAHRKRNIGDASALYGRLLALEPPRTPSEEERAWVLRFAPRLFNVAGEYFPLKDVAAILHPDRPVIAYHLFWDDDVGFPADNEPCDHEIVWVEFDPATSHVVHVWTYFHGRVVHTEDAVTDANAHAGRPWIAVEWGFHGSIPWGALEIPQTGVRVVLEKHWRLARNPPEKPHPLARGWPERFAGDFAAYTTFTQANDPAPLLEGRGMIYVGRWATAALNRYCLRYNFAAKIEWPWLVRQDP